MSFFRLIVPVLLLTISSLASGQEGGGPPPERGGFGGPGGPPTQDLKLVKEFDADKDGRLSRSERDLARAALKDRRANQRGPQGRGRRPVSPEGEPASRPNAGLTVDAKDVKTHAGHTLYDASVVRTIFLTFDQPDWEQELGAFSNTDVEVPASLLVDGQVYPGVGVKFRGASSLFTVGEGQKRSLNISVDFTDEKQRVLGAKTLNLLNAHSDPSFLHTVLYSEIAASYIPAPRANFVQVVINGESWGVYVNTQQFDKIFLEDHYGDSSGTRWKVPGSPRGAAGLEYLGDAVADYEKKYEMKSGSSQKAWRDFIDLCRILNETPIEKLEAALAPKLDLEGVLKFLALEVVFHNSDGYWVRASDYCIFQDKKGQFHIVPHDMNETFQAGGGPGMGPGGGRRGERGRRPPGEGPIDPRPDQPSSTSRPTTGLEPRGGQGSGVELDPLVALDDPSKPLRSKLLKVPSLRRKYLEYVREMSEKWLDWKHLGPRVAHHVVLIDALVAVDTRKLSTYEEFQAAVSGAAGLSNSEEPENRRRRMSLRTFTESRRRFLLEHPAIQGLGKRDKSQN